MSRRRKHRGAGARRGGRGCENPPKAEYIHPHGQCIPLYSDPVTGTPVAYLGDAIHITYPLSGPALPGWAGIALAALLVGGGIFVFGKRRKEPAT